MVKIGIIKGKKDDIKKVFSDRYKGMYIFKLKFKDSSRNCEFKNDGLAFTVEDDMEVEVWADVPEGSEIRFTVSTIKMEDLK